MPPLNTRIFPNGEVPGMKPAEPAPAPQKPMIPPTRTSAPAAGFQRSPIPPIGWNNQNPRWDKGGVIPQQSTYSVNPGVKTSQSNAAPAAAPAPVPINATVGISVSPTSVAPGGTVTVNVSATNATSVTLSTSNTNPAFGPYSLPATGGSQSVVLSGVKTGQNITFTASASPSKKGGLKATGSTSVAIT